MNSRAAQPFCPADLFLHGEESGERGTVCRAQVSGNRGVVGKITSGLTAEKAHLSLLLPFLLRVYQSWFAQAQGSVLSGPGYLSVTLGESRQHGFESQSFFLMGTLRASWLLGSFLCIWLFLQPLHCRPTILDYSPVHSKLAAVLSKHSYLGSQNTFKQP